MSQAQWSAWTPIGLGSYVRYRYGSALPLFLLGLPGAMGVSGAVMGKVLIVGVLLGSGWTMYMLSGELIRVGGLDSRGHWAFACRLTAGLVYMLSPFQYDQIIAGDVLGLVAYALAPAVVLLATAGVTRPSGLVYASAAGMAAALSASCSVQTALFTGMLTVSLCLVLGRAAFWRTLGRLAFIGIAALACSAYWLVPVLAGVHLTLDALVSTSGTLGASSIGFKRYDSVLSAAVGTSYFVPFYTQGIAEPVVRVWRGLVLSGLALALLPLVSGSRRTPFASWYWIAVYVIGVCLSSPGSVIGAPVRWLYQQAIWALFFRTPQHLAFLVAFATAVIVAVGTAAFRPRLLRLGQPHRSRACRAKGAAAGVERALPLVLASTLALGYVVGPPFKGYIGPYPQSNGEAMVNTILSSDTDSQGRVIAFPEGTSRLFDSRAKGRDISLEAGDDGDLIWGLHPAITSEVKWSADVEARNLERMLYSQLLSDPQRAAPLLRLLSVKYVLVAPWYSAGAGPEYMRYNPRAVVADLDKLAYLVPLFRSQGWFLFRNTDYDGRVAVYGGTPAQTGARSTAAAAVLDSLLQSRGGTINLTPEPALQPTGTGGRIDATALRLLPASSKAEWRTDFQSMTQETKDELQRPATSLAFVARAAGRESSAIVFLGTTGVSGYESRISVGPSWRTFTVPLAELIPFGTPDWAQASYLTIKTPNGSAIDVRDLRVVAGGAAKYSLRGWFVERNLYPATWNYFDPYPHPSFRLSSAYAGPATIALHFTTPAPANYSVAVLVHGSEWSPASFSESVDSRSTRTVALPHAREDLVAVYIGEESLAQGGHVITLGASCEQVTDPSRCDLGVYDLLLAPLPPTDTIAAGLASAEVHRSSDTDYSARIASTRGATLVLRDSYDVGWSALGVRQGSTRTVTLIHGRYAGGLNGWTVPAGSWAVRVVYQPQATYTRAIIASVVGAVLLIAVAAASLWVVPSASRRRTRQCFEWD